MWQFIAFLLWTTSHMVKILALFFINPGQQYEEYIAPLADPNNDAKERYQESGTFWVSGTANSATFFFFPLALALMLIEWIQIESLVATQRRN